MVIVEVNYEFLSKEGRLPKKVPLAIVANRLLGYSRHQRIVPKAILEVALWVPNAHIPFFDPIQVGRLVLGHFRLKNRDFASGLFGSGIEAGTFSLEEKLESPLEFPFIGKDGQKVGHFKRRQDGGHLRGSGVLFMLVQRKNVLNFGTVFRLGSIERLKRVE